MSTKKIRKNTSDPTDAQRADRLYTAVDQFEYGSELAKRVYHLGTPRFTDSGSTASMTVTQDGQPVFEFNRAYFDGLGHDEMVFVVLHETLHFALCHPLRRYDRSPALWNVACDLVANAFLLQKAGFAKITGPSFHKFLESAITFENLPIAPAAGQLSLTAEQVYDLLTNDIKTVQGNAFNIKACDEHEWSESDSDSVPERSETIDRLAEQAQQIFREWLPGWGDSSSGELRAVGETTKSVNISWDSILSRRIASCIQLAIEQRWAPPNRKIGWLYPAVLLPADREVERRRLSVLIAIDASGSISPPVLDRLVSVACSIPPDKVLLIAVSFDTQVYPVDIGAKAPEVRGGGGTSFNVVEAFAKDLREYPDLIVVLTDGFAPRPSIQHPERWFWLITRQGTTNHIEGIGSYCLIDDVKSVSPCYEILRSNAGFPIASRGIGIRQVQSRIWRVNTSRTEKRL